MLRKSVEGTVKTGDPLIDEPCLSLAIDRDLILLENQIPFFILEKLFDPIVSILCGQTFHELTIDHFGFKGKGGSYSKFRHFTDLFRSVRVETVPNIAAERPTQMYHMLNAHKLDRVGVKLKVVEDEFSVLVRFDDGVLEIPKFMADDDAEITIRNIMALEQCHYSSNAHVCDYILFLDFLIDTQKDVHLLAEKGIVTNWLGNHRSVAKMVNKLGLGVNHSGSYNSKIASDVMRHYKDKWNKSRSILRRGYFSNMWRGTATLVAALLLLLTVMQTVNSFIDVLQN